MNAKVKARSSVTARKPLDAAFVKFAKFRDEVSQYLIEREPEYQADIARRMDLATKPSKRAAVAKTKGNISDLGPLFAAVSDT